MSDSKKIIAEKEINIKEELYILFLEIKGELSKRCIEIDKSQFVENISNIKLETLLNYLKEIIYILLNNKFKISDSYNSFVENNYKEKKLLNPNISQLENEIKKYQADIRYLVQKQFQYKVQKDALEIKLNSYLEMEKEYEKLKEKVKYEEGHFLKNDRKDSEILILREENSNLKKEILKNEKKEKNFELKIKKEQLQIKQLKDQLNELNKKLIVIENNQIQNNNNFHTNHNSSILNGRKSTRWTTIKKEKDEKLSSNNSNITSHRNNSLKKKAKISNIKFSKLEMKGINNLNERTLSRGNNNNILNNNYKKKRGNKEIKTIDNNKIFNKTYIKILNGLINNKINNNIPSIPSKKTIVASSHKKNSISMYVDNSYKNDEYKKYSSKKNSKNKYSSKRKIYNKLMNIPNSKIPSTNKNHLNKNIIPSLSFKYFIKNNTLY